MIGIVHLPLWFGDKGKAKNLEVDFLMVDMPMIYNVIIGRSTLHKIKAVMTPYLLQIQYELDNGS